VLVALPTLGRFCGYVAFGIASGLQAVGNVATGHSRRQLVWTFGENGAGRTVLATLVLSRIMPKENRFGFAAKKKEIRSELTKLCLFLDGRQTRTLPTKCARAVP